MEEAIQDFEGPAETRMIGLRSGKVFGQTSYLMGKVPKEMKNQ